MRPRGFRLEVLPHRDAARWVPALSGQFTGETDEQASTFDTLTAAEGMARALLAGLPTAWRIVDTSTDAVVLLAVPRRPEPPRSARPSFLKSGSGLAPLSRRRGPWIYTPKGLAFYLTRFA